MADGGRIPRLVIEMSAMRSLPLGAADGFVLSRIDGRASERELASLTGLPEAQIRASLDKLASLKAIDFGSIPAPTPSRPNISGSTNSASTPGTRGGQPAPAAAPATPAAEATPKPEAGGPALAQATGATNALLASAIAGVPADAPELAEDVDLPLELRRRILGLHSVASSLDHYALLGLTRDADKKGVKRSYFELAALFHPDRYFRKNLGSFKPKMEVIFAKVSTAYETLVDKAQRAEYDEYLGDVEKSRAVEAMLRNVIAEVATAEQTVLESAASSPSLVPPDAGSQPSISSVPPAQPDGAATYSVPLPRGAAAPAPAAPAPPRHSAVSDQLRREALAMRLKGGRPVTKPPLEVIPTNQVPPPPRSSPTEAVDALKRRYEDRVDAGRRQQGKKYMDIGEAAEARNDLTAAAAAYRVALTFVREDEPTYAHAKEMIAKSELSLGETYLRQAQHEEKAGKWEDAVRSWSRASKLRPTDHHALERYAHALVKTGGDLHEAAQIAKRAVEQAPTQGDYRCTLAAVYVAANLSLNAKRELEAAALQFPENMHIKAMLSRITKPA